MCGRIPGISSSCWTHLRPDDQHRRRDGRSAIVAGECFGPSSMIRYVESSPKWRLTSLICKTCTPWRLSPAPKCAAHFLHCKSRVQMLLPLCDRQSRVGWCPLSLRSALYFVGISTTDCNYLPRAETSLGRGCSSEALRDVVIQVRCL